MVSAIIGYNNNAYAEIERAASDPVQITFFSEKDKDYIIYSTLEPKDHIIDIYSGILNGDTVEEVKKPGPTAVEEPKDFILNTVKMNSKEARKIMINDKSIKAGGTSGVDKAINKAINTKGPIGFANYTLQYVGDK